jgi:quercetin dioxygenase-like cupin family protein
MKPADLLPEFARDALGADQKPDEERALVEAFAALSAGLEPVQPSSEARARLLAAVSEERHAPFFERLSRLFDLGVERVREIMALADDPASWEPGPMPGVMLMHFGGGPAVATADVGLVRIEAGFAFPRHRHLGTERALIIEGGYADDSGKQYRPGDVHEMHEGTVHSYKVFDSGPMMLALVLYTGIDVQGP